ncbi:MAG: 3-hydroxyisobutyrate dehydrogenase [Pseudomonadota bacterium]|jgi:3-hydroxyisobutyrate dehydrogenase
MSQSINHRTTNHKPIIAFIGLGNMGAPMAHNLLKAGYALHVFDLSRPAMQALVDAGARAAASAGEAVQEAQVVISMLPASTHVQALYLGLDGNAGGGILPRIAPAALLIDCSTIAAQTSQQLAQAAQQRGLAMLDAPVSGGTAGAQAATLTFIVGGDSAALEQARPVLSSMGKNIFHAGGHGAGQTAKICNNLLLGILMAGTAEALALGVANGLDPKVLSGIMCQSSGRNWALEQYNPWPGVMPNVPASRGYSGGFGVDLMQKDLGLALDAANTSHAAAPLGQVAQQLYARHSQQGAGSRDFSSILEYLRAMP